MKFLTATFGIILALSASPAVAQPPPNYAPIPPPRHEHMPPQPHGNVVWQPGHWHWDGHQYVWVGGHYVERHPHHRTWAAGHWAWSHRDNRYIWNPPHWR